MLRNGSNSSDNNNKMLTTMTIMTALRAPSFFLVKQTFNIIQLCCTLLNEPDRRLQRCCFWERKKGWTIQHLKAWPNKFNMLNSSVQGLLLRLQHEQKRGFLPHQRVPALKSPITFSLNHEFILFVIVIADLFWECACFLILCVWFQHGKINQIRLVTNRAGKPKGFGYIEYEQEVRSDQQSCLFFIVFIFILNHILNISMKQRCWKES